MPFLYHLSRSNFSNFTLNVTHVQEPCGWYCRSSQCLRVTDSTTGQSLGWEPFSDATNWKYHPQQDSHRTGARLQLQRLCEYPDPCNPSMYLEIIVVWQRTVRLWHRAFWAIEHHAALELTGLGVQNEATLAGYLLSKTGPCSDALTYYSDQPVLCMENSVRSI